MTKKKMGFRDFVKFWEKSVHHQDQEDYVEAARSVLRLVRWDESLCWDLFDEAKHFGPVFIPIANLKVPTEEKLQKKFEEGCGIDISTGKYTIVTVPHQLIGTSAYVAFEKPIAIAKQK